jgi:hypothetical protein
MVHLLPVVFAFVLLSALSGFKYFSLLNGKQLFSHLAMADVLNSIKSQHIF